MPEYRYESPDGEIKDIFQSMSEEHVYFEDGVEWKRVFVTPQFNMGETKIDPFSSKEFVDKTGNMKGTYGDMLDFAEEQSQIRAEKMGEDPVKRAYFDKHEKRTGKKHWKDKPEKIENDFFEVSDLGNDNLED